MLLFKKSYRGSNVIIIWWLVNWYCDHFIYAVQDLYFMPYYSLKNSNYGKVF